MGIFIFFYQKESYMIWGAAEGNLLILYLWSFYAGNLTPVPAPHLVESVNLHQWRYQLTAWHAKKSISPSLQT